MAAGGLNNTTHQMTPADLNLILAGARTSTVVCLYYTASWCGACKKIEPLIQSFVNKYDDLEMYKTDADVSKELLDAHAVKKLPTFVFFKNGQPHATHEGANPQAVAATFSRLLIE